jgi:hypothetical protein
MLRELTCSVRVVLQLNNESYTNDGLTQAEMREALERLPVVAYTRNGCINHNIDVYLSSAGLSVSDEVVEELMMRFENMFEAMLARKVTNGPQ